MDAMIMSVPGRKEWRVVSESVPAQGRDSSRGFISVPKNGNNNSRMFHSSANVSEHSSDSDQPLNSMHADDSTIYEIKHVQQSNGQLDIGLGSLSLDGGNSEESLQQRLHEITRQREQLQQLEIDLKTQFIVKAKVMRLQSGFDEQAKQHASIVADLQNRAVHDILLYKEEQLREAQAWATRVQELDAIHHLNNNHSLQAELRDRTNQLNQLWLSCQKQFADAERYYLQTIHQLQLELAEAREHCKSINDSSGLTENDEKKAAHPESKSGRFDSNGELTSAPSQKGNSTVSNSQSKTGMLTHNNIDGAFPLVLFRDMPPKMQADYAAALPIAPSPPFGMGHILPSDPVGVVHQFGTHQQGIPQNLQPSGVPVPQPTFGQFQSMSPIVPPQQIMAPQHQQPIENNHQYLQHQSMPIQQISSRQQQNLNIQFGTKLHALHPNNQDIQRHSHESQTRSELVEAQEQEVRESNEEQHENFSRLLQHEYDCQTSQKDETPFQQPEGACQQISQEMPLHVHFKASDESQQFEQHHLPSFSQHQSKIQQSYVDMRAPDSDFESCSLSHAQNKQINMDQIVPVSQASVSALQSDSLVNPVGLTPEPDCKNILENTEQQISATDPPHKQKAGDGFAKSPDPPLLDERSLLACFVRVIPAEAGARIKISSTLPNRLGKMLAPLHWHDYRKKYGRLDDFVASHPELFVVEGDFVHLREGAHATISATTAVAKVAAAAAAAASPVGMSRMPTVAVTPVAQSQIHRLRKGIINNPRDSKTVTNASASNQQQNRHVASLRQGHFSALNGTSEQTNKHSHAELGSANIIMTSGIGEGRAGNSIKQEHINPPQRQDNRLSKIDASAASVR
eukprot:TRINITY_DN1640_c0_g1_i2.p1 TRINITY_DN1640_c0_g1~~TRINITY_DN1640_c0_g1_i2.p1  ORF type:complete len:854 (+),score=213.93 TRINITY_DN1640_c0_g1_i2:292-2853(+)